MSPPYPLHLLWVVEQDHPVLSVNERVFWLSHEKEKAVPLSFSVTVNMK